MTEQGDIMRAIQQEFALDGDDPAAFIHELGARIRRLENALESRNYVCPECGGPVEAMVLDTDVGAIWVDASCDCDGVEEWVTATAMERWRLGDILGGQQVAAVADDYILGEDVTHLARPKARDNQETSASSPAQQIDVRGEEGQCDAV